MLNPKKNKDKGEQNLYLNIVKDLISIRIRPLYGRKDFLLRLGLDLFIANVGLLIGYFITVVYYLMIDKSLGIQWASDILFRHWLNTVPLLTVVCIFSFTLSGLYSYGLGFTLIHRLLVVFRAVSTSFLIFVFFVYLLQQIGSPKFFLFPRSSIIVGWLVVLILMLTLRGARIIFFHNLILIPRTETEELLNTSKKLEIAARESGWVPAEKTETVGKKSSSVSSYFALWPYFGEDVIDEVSSVLRTGRVNRWTGEQNALFELEFSKFCNCRHSIAVGNGSLALELALKALGIGPGDEVIVPCRTFIASASCVVMCGARPVLVDIDRESQNLTSLTIQEAITPRTKAIIAVHLAGWPCDMDSIMALAKENEIKVIEDCAQAHGAVYKGKPVGSLGDVAAFSFCQDKIMSTGGEGGMLMTNSDALWKKAWAFKDHGKAYDTVYIKSHPPGFQWLHEDFGTNWRMTEMQAAIGKIVLKKLPSWVRTRQKYARLLTDGFSKIPGLRVTIPPDYIEHSYYKYYTFILPESLRKDWNRDRIMVEINKEGIPCFSGICGQIHMEKAFEKYDLLPSHDLPISKELMDTSLMFLVHPTLTLGNIEDTIKVVTKVMNRATS